MDPLILSTTAVGRFNVRFRPKRWNEELSGQLARGAFVGVCALERAAHEGDRHQKGTARVARLAITSGMSRASIWSP